MARVIGEPRQLPGRITISRHTGTQKHYMSVEIDDAASGTRVLEFRLEMEEFAMAVTGHGYVPGTIVWFDNNRVGTRHEHKVERVQLPEGFNRSAEDRKAEAAPILAPHEVDGWKGVVSDLFNHHRQKHTSGQQWSAEVAFHRWVDPETGEPVEL